MNQRSANAKLTDVEYDLVKDLLLYGSFKGGNRPNNRLFIEAILYVMRTGCQWRELPSEFPNWKSVYSRFSLWNKSEVWGKVWSVLKKSYKTNVRNECYRSILQ